MPTFFMESSSKSDADIMPQSTSHLALSAISRARWTLARSIMALAAPSMKMSPELSSDTISPFSAHQSAQASLARELP